MNTRRRRHRLTEQDVFCIVANVVLSAFCVALVVIACMGAA